VSSQRLLARLRQRLHRTPPAYPEWARILGREAEAWRAAREAAADGPRVLVATSFGGHLACAHLETTLAVALTLRGALVHLLLCDTFLPACQQAEIGALAGAGDFAAGGPQPRFCTDCWAPAGPAYNALGLPLHTYSQLVTREEAAHARTIATTIPFEEVSGFRFDGLAVGEHALAGALRFYARGDLEGAAEAPRVVARYLEAALLTVFAVRRLLGSEGVEIACFNHGIYVPQGLVGEVVRSTGGRVVNWNPAYRKGCFIFSHGDTYHHTLLDEPTAVWEGMRWTRKRERVLVDYLESRKRGTRDWIWFHERPEEQVEVIERELGIDLSRPTIGLLTNVIWDAQLHYRANAFPSMMHWVLESIRHFAEKPQLQLVIRVHPAEIRGTVPSRQNVVDEIARHYGALPANVFVVTPESQVSTYAIMERCNAVLIYGTKTGVELTARGIPVIVAGEAWIRNKGLTMDASTEEEYRSLLDRLPLPGRLDEATVRRARIYAYHFFFRRMIPVRAMRPTGGWPPYRLHLRSLRQLAPNADPGLDTICDGIIAGTPFVAP
jgi:hypothetical protein